MPTSEHEMPIEFLHNRPELATTLLERVFGIQTPDHDKTELVAADCTDNQPKEFRADGVVLLRHEGANRLAIVVEVQRGDEKEEKRYAWPVYLASVRARLRCPAVLLVICPDKRTARWARKPIDMGHPEWTLRPLVVGYDDIPLVTSAAEGRAMPELAVLSALAHGGKSRKTLVACAEALKSLPNERLKIYHGFLRALLSGAARRNWEAFMEQMAEKYENEFARRYEAEGEARGEARGEATAVLRVLKARGIPVSDKARERITSCTDLDQLSIWLDRVSLVDSTDKLFD